MNNYLVPMIYRHIKLSIGNRGEKKKERKEDKRNEERERNGSGRKMENLKKKV